ncbi:hypothetical protein CGMCC3_g13692 [Colletotrichum fructicola]|uniref:Uncharacterized protein n=1 Tax=Colletotrichum fructicola (strain Nara gc5) TaxID=1213859 RepID=A0A7J6IP33_COLFN|nr:uncharacterized protein CGMCC3_g13692 [Colletotrichum fructicola]KAE9570178.1 hypothetical protein CGMCC3_g13692 [Colletotrichum fructicola]KAF4421633.1 hypothetical protein CFRS1_v013910 [Colletotrichum fructicola]KAF4477961.1 hypothetical protein CGGC5_v014160 [Colletotrichum fructicola Nara gc5]KAF5493935.1 hypothetical protein CGCF413_v009376 [Colletotrichum fructicola]
MQGFGTLILATLAAAVAAKDCAFFYNSHVDTSLYEGIPTSNAIWYCENDIGGKMASDESNLSNSATNPDFRLATTLCDAATTPRASALLEEQSGFRMFVQSRMNALFAELCP